MKPWSLRGARGQGYTCSTTCHHEVWCWGDWNSSLVSNKSNKLITSTNLLLGVSGNGTDLLEWSRNLFLSARDEETGSSNSIVSSTLQLLLLVHLFIEHLASVLYSNLMQHCTNEHKQGSERHNGCHALWWWRPTSILLGKLSLDTMLDISLEAIVKLLSAALI